MDDDIPQPDWPEIITQLRLEAGRVMEDTADELAMTLAGDNEALGISLCGGRQAADDIQSLLAAAQVLHRRFLAVGSQD